MLKFDDLETVVVDAINAAIQEGYLLIAGETATKWDSESSKWVWNPEGCRSQACDLAGAVLLTQPPVEASVHRGDTCRAFRAFVDPDFYTTSPDPDLDTLLESDAYQVTQNLLNGWDSEEFVGGSREAFDLGTRLASIYRPPSIEVFALQSPANLKVVTLDDFEDGEDIEEDLLDRESGVRRVGDTSGVELLEITEIEVSTG